MSDEERPRRTFSDAQTRAIMGKEQARILAAAQEKIALIEAGSRVEADVLAVLRELVGVARTSPLMACIVGLIILDPLVQVKVISSGTRGLIQALIVASVGVDLASEIIDNLPIPFAQKTSVNPALLAVPNTVVLESGKAEASPGIVGALAGTVPQGALT